MSDLCSTINSGLADCFEKIGVKLHHWVYPLSQEQFWRNPFPYGNDVGHLVLHLTGNLHYYIGTQIAATGYVRHRDVEFTDAARPHKAEVLRKFDDAVAMVAKTIRKQFTADWSAAYSALGVDCPDRFSIVLDCAAHADHHAGQIINLSRELTRSN
jgi:Protein of unknown function (DUF1572)